MANNPNESIRNSGRLSSFRSPRDLTLGGGGFKKRQPSKIFTPNLQSTRNKNNPSNDTKNTNEKDAKGTRNNGDKVRFNDKRRKNNLIQTEGVFSEGTGLMPLRKSDNWSGGSSRDVSIESLRKPTLAKRDAKLDHKMEQKQLKDLLGDDDDDVAIEEESKSSDSDNFKPIKLIDRNKRVSKNTDSNDSNLSLKSIEIKSEPDTESNCWKTETQIDSNSLINGIKKEPDEIKQNLFKSDSGLSAEPAGEVFDGISTQLFLMQLPDTLPGKTSGPDENKLEDNVTTEPNRCTMLHLQEGHVGKIVRYKSGRTKLILGEARYDIEIGLNSGFLQEVVSISTNPEKRSGNMVNLGQIEEKLNVIPDWEYLFNKSSA